MIDLAMEFIRDELNKDIVSRIPMGASDRVVISNVVQQEEGDGGNLSDLKDDRMLLSLIHLEEDRIFKDQSRAAITTEGTVRYREPDIRLNVYLIFSAHFGHYLTGIKHLSATISFFQANNVFDTTQYPSMNPLLKRVVMDLHSFSLDQNFQFWQSLGGKFLPSVMYKMRLLVFQEEFLQSQGPPIIELRTNLDGKT